jgi:hypothetical protein
MSVDIENRPVFHLSFILRASSDDTLAALPQLVGGLQGEHG